jgi:DNA-binding NtrC family response regulator
LTRENQFLKAQLATVDEKLEILGKSVPIQEMIENLRRAAQMDTTVLVLGESGTGKELAARFLHRHSPRAKEHFVAINCAAIPAELLESELFGHEAGAFTGAGKARIGLFENADRGTVFLDEIGEMPVQLQAKLLRVLEDRKVRRVGANKERSIDIRVICATNRNLADLVSEKSFREDLYYRLNVITIRVPPLREHKEDIMTLLQHFFLKHASRQHPAPSEISAEVRAALFDYPWPGNIRELSNLAQFLIFADRNGTIELGQLPPQFAKSMVSKSSVGPVADLTMPVHLLDQAYLTAKSEVEEAFEKAYVERNLAKYDWNISLTAEKTGMDRRTAHRLIAKFNIQKPS